jgi:heterodisulfide reductase subunit B
MKISYYPGCTLKTKAKNFEDSALASLAALGIEVEELPRWNCCGAVYSLADDDLLHQVAPVRVLVRAKDEGADKLLTLCSQCYNVLARANRLMRDDEEKRGTINTFMDEETDYFGEVEVVHLLDLLRTEVGWDSMREKLSAPLEGFRIAPYYGCALTRPRDVAVGQHPTRPTIFKDFIAALGAVPVDFPRAEECCGAYENLVNPDEGTRQAAKVLSGALAKEADALVLSCPLCEYNLSKRQERVRAARPGLSELPVFYFTQLLALALGVEPERSRFELNHQRDRAVLESRGLLSTAAQGTESAGEENPA